MCVRGSECPLTVTIGNTDLPGYLHEGCVYVETPLRLVFEALAEDLPAFVRDMEIGISSPWGAALSLDRDGCAVYRETVAVEGVV